MESQYLAAGQAQQWFLLNDGGRAKFVKECLFFLVLRKYILQECLMKRNLFESYPYSHRTWSKGKLTLRRKRPVINCWKKWFVEERRARDT